MTERSLSPSGFRPIPRRGRLARSRIAVKKHPDYSEHGYFLAVETAFKQWEAMQNTGHSDRPAHSGQHGGG